MREIYINKNDAGQRLDKFLNKFMPKLPQSMLYKGLRKNCVRINDKRAKDGSVFLKEGDVLKLYFKDEFFEEKKAFTPVKCDFDIVYEDENILLINKKSGTVVHTDDRGTKNSLVEQIQSYLYQKGEFNPENEHSFSPSLCNRLDRNTSGIIIAAKNAEALRILNEKIRLREIRKMYLCIAEGVFDKKSGTMKGYLTRGDKKVSISDARDDASKYAELQYRVIEEGNGFSLIEVELLTGRTHQIRAQMAHSGHPLKGDKKYGGSKSPEYQELMSHRLIFDFKTESGILSYLTGKEFSLSGEAVSTFSQMN